MHYARPPAPTPAHDMLDLWPERNERRRLLGKDVVEVDERVPFVCESAGSDCVRPIVLTMHELVLLREDRFWIVELKAR
jgi:hypothetical protein